MNEVKHICEWVIQPVSIGFIHPVATQMNCSIMVEDMPKNPDGFFILKFLIEAPNEDVYEEFVEHLATQIAFTNCVDAATYVSTIAYPDKSGLHVPHLTGGSFIEALQGFGVANQRLAKRRDSWLKKVTSRILDLLALYPKQ